MSSNHKFIGKYWVMCHSEEQSDEESLLVDMSPLERFFAYAQNDLFNWLFCPINSNLLGKRKQREKSSLAVCLHLFYYFSVFNVNSLNSRCNQTTEFIIETVFRVTNILNGDCFISVCAN